MERKKDDALRRNACYDDGALLRPHRVRSDSYGQRLRQLRRRRDFPRRFAFRSGRRRDRGRNRLGSCRHFQRIRGLRRVHARGKSRRRFRVRLGVQTPFSHSKTGRSPYYFDGSRFAVRYRGLLFHRLDSVRNSGGLSQPSQFAYSGQRKYGDSVRRSSAPSRTVRRRTER